MRLTLMLLCLAGLAMGQGRIEVSHLNQDGIFPFLGFAPGSLAILSVDAAYDNYGVPYPASDRLSPVVRFQQGVSQQELVIVRSKQVNSLDGYAVQIPITAKLGKANLIVRLGSRQLSVEVMIVRLRFEFVRNPRVKWQVTASKDGVAVGLVHPLQTGKMGTIMATGLGANPDQQTISLQFGNPPIETGFVRVRKDGKGLDLLEFEVPPTVVGGCAVPVQAFVNGVLADNLAVPISRDEGVCSNSWPFTLSELQVLDSGQCLPLRFVRIGSERELQKGEGAQYSLNDPVSTQFGTYSAEAIGFSDSTAASLPVGCRLDRAVVYGVGGSGPGSVFVDPYRDPISCPDPTISDFTDGVKLSLKGPSGRVFSLLPNESGTYGLQLSDSAAHYSLDTIPPSPYESGTWEFSGTETERFNSFQWHFPIYPMRGQNIQTISTISKNLGVMLKWDPTGYKVGDTTLASLMLPFFENEAKGIYCNVAATDGQVFIPPTLLETLIGTDGRQAARLVLMIVPKYEIRRSETKNGQTFPTFINNFFADVRPVTIQ